MYFKIYINLKYKPSFAKKELLAIKQFFKDKNNL